MSDIEKKSGTQAADYESQIADLKHQRDVGTFVLPTPEEEKRIIRKLDARLIPLVFVLYSLAVLDRSNLGNAKLAGMEEEIDLSGNRYQLLGTIFYIFYIVSQPTMLGWKQFKPHNFAAFTVLFWGFVASVQAAAFSWGGLMTCRAFLGIAEAMFGPGVPLYLSYFYPREKVGFRHGVFISGAAMANAYGGVLAYGISQIRGSIGPWRILFLIEGLPTLVFAGITWWFLPDSISTAPFLSEREKQVALHFVARNQKVDVGSEKGIIWKELFSAFKDPKSFLPAFMYFGW
jgi:MFS family permease